MIGLIMFCAALLLLAIGYPVGFTFGSVSIFFGILAAVVEVACADGKLSRLGVPTLTAIAGWSGRVRRTTRLMTTAAAWARNAPTPTVIHSRRRRGARPIRACKG